MENNFFIRYQVGDSFLEKLNGRSKVLLWISSIFLLMLSYDLRILLPALLLHIFLFLSVYKGEKQVKVILVFLLLSNLFNLALLYVYNPRIGSDMAQKTTLLWQGNEHFVLTYETLIFFLARLLKVMSSFFVSLWLILSITPSQLAEGLNRIGVSYRIGTILSLALRYIPDVWRDYKSIKEAMQLRGEEWSSQKASLLKRIKASIQVLIPLLLVSFEKVDVISSAMELRSYGKFSKRSYYISQEDSPQDKWVMFFSLFQILLFGAYVFLMLKGIAPKEALWLPPIF